MRKKTVSHIADTIFWYLLYFLPVILIVVGLYGQARSEVYWDWFFTREPGIDRTGFPMFMDVGELFVHLGVYTNPVAIALEAAFGSSGVFPLFSIGGVALPFMTWFISVYILHLAVDFVLFIPRLAHKWMNSFTRCD